LHRSSVTFTGRRIERSFPGALPEAVSEKNERFQAIFGRDVSARKEKVRWTGP
jgi:hypothetical protein